MKISVFIPAYNAVNHLEGVIDRIPKPLWDEITSVWIINDGSTDDTGQLIDSLAFKNQKIKPHHFRKNRGYGEVVKKGLSLCRTEQCDYAVCLHADGQYPPEHMTPLILEMAHNGIDLLQGSRHASGTALSGGMPFYKYISGKLLVALENKVFRMNFSDYHSGFLLYSKRALSTIPFEQLSGGFQIDLEIIASARTRGLSLAERPIPTRYADEKSYLNPVKYGLQVLTVLLHYKQGKYR